MVQVTRSSVQSSRQTALERLTGDMPTSTPSTEPLDGKQGMLFCNGFN